MKLDDSYANLMDRLSKSLYVHEACDRVHTQMCDILSVTSVDLGRVMRRLRTLYRESMQIVLDEHRTIFNLLVTTDNRLQAAEATANVLQQDVQKRDRKLVEQLEERMLQYRQELEMVS
jgi:hypothetical protein